MWLLIAFIAALGLTALNGSPSVGAYHVDDDPGYWMVGSDGAVHAFGSVENFGDVPTQLQGPAPTPIVAMASTPHADGYVILAESGRLYFFGNAHNLGSAVGQLLDGEVAAAVAMTPSGNGYWIFTSLGRVFAFGDAVHKGDLAAFTLAGPIVSSVPTPSGNGYYMLGSDGGVFAFGDADFFGSVQQFLDDNGFGIGANDWLAAPIVGIVPTSTGLGYWLVASDGGVFAFGDAGFVGSIPGVLSPGASLAAPINGMVAYGNGYLMVAWDGGVFNFATDLLFLGSLGGQVLPAPIVGVVPLPS